MFKYIFHYYNNVTISITFVLEVMTGVTIIIECIVYNNVNKTQLKMNTFVQ